MANLAKATDPIVARLGLTPAIPVRTKYDFVRSKSGDVRRALIDKDALITTLGQRKSFEGGWVLTGSSDYQKRDFAILCDMDIFVAPSQARNAHFTRELKSTIRRKPIP